MTPGPADRGDRDAAADRLRERDEVGRDAAPSTAPPGAIVTPVFTVERQERAVPVQQLLSEAR
jgi:hypothetical protein